MRTTFGCAILALTLGACNFPTATPTAVTSAAVEVFPPTATPIPAKTEPLPSATSGDEPRQQQAATLTPPGLRVAFSSSGNLWSTVAGDTPNQLNSAGNVSEIRITDDGQRIAYVLRDPQANTTELRSVVFDGSGDQLLLDQAAIDALYPLEEFTHYTLAQMQYLPGTHSLLFNTRGVFAGPGLANNDDVLVIDVDGGELSTVLARGQGGNFVISPDGSQLAIVRPESVGFANSDGSSVRSEVLTFPRVRTFSEFFFYPIPVWVGEAVMVPVPQEDPFATPATGMVWEVPASGGEPVAIASTAGDLYRPQAERPLISADGTTVAYLGEAVSANEQQLVLFNPSSGERLVADSGSIHWDGWSPDSDHFTYARGSGLDLQLGALGVEPAPIGSGSGLRWVDSTQYLYLAGTPGVWALTLSDLEGNSTVLAAPTGNLVTYDFAR